VVALGSLVIPNADLEPSQRLRRDHSMPLYRFNLEDHRFIADRGVRECLDDEHAKEIANEIAEHLVQSEPELLAGGHAVVVRRRRN
jgi:hypothetical protein